MEKANNQKLTQKFRINTKRNSQKFPSQNSTMIQFDSIGYQKVEDESSTAEEGRLKTFDLCYGRKW